VTQIGSAQQEKWGWCRPKSRCSLYAECSRISVLTLHLPSFSPNC